MSRVSFVLCLGIFAVCLIVPATGSWWGDWGSMIGNWTGSTEPIENCPHNYTELNLCSRLIEFEYPCYHLACCQSGGSKEEMVLQDAEVHDGTGGKCPNSMCIETRQCAYYICFTECCNGHHRNSDGTCRNTSSEMTCKNGGTMMKTEDGFPYCYCRPGFMGEDCGKPYCGGCEGHGDCVIKDGKPVCECYIGYEGNNCDIRKCYRPCFNGGKCIRDDRREMCNCTLPFVGKSCEVKHEDSEQCPEVTYHDLYRECHFYCNKDTDCYGDSHCCREGCSLVCKRPKTKTCYRNGRTFAAGEYYKPNDCTHCICTTQGTFSCSNTTQCPEIMCSPGSRPVRKPGKCCPSCEFDESFDEPKIICPEFPINLDLHKGKRTVELTAANTGVRAFDCKRKPLRVWFEPFFLRHCECENSRTLSYEVVAYTSDGNGGKAKCRFSAFVRDREPPVFTSCPEDRYIMEGDHARWLEPSFKDNVGIALKSCSPRINGKRLKKGSHSVLYMVEDYDGNKAICNFTIYSIAQDTPHEMLPEGLKERQKQDELNIGVVAAPILGAIGLFAIIIALCLCIRKRRLSQNEGAQSARPARQAYENNIYHLPTDVKLTPPPYTLPYNPPAYSAQGDMKEAEYATIAPPTYSESVSGVSNKSYNNPNYATLGQKSEI